MGFTFVPPVKTTYQPCRSRRVFIMSRTQDEKYMRRAIDLAKAGEGWVHPNPLVGAVIVKDGRIIGEGYHRKYGQLHAERNAIADAKRRAGEPIADEQAGSGEADARLLAGATIYVTLEPCCHYGKTPPCTEAIIENRIARVVIGSRDPNPLVAGKGAQILRDAGIAVEEDFLREDCDELNPVFFHYIRTKQPYVIMKYAMTADGKIATKTGASKWITGEEARREVHRIRHACMGIMAGIGTVLADDPLLNCRIEGATEQDLSPYGPCQPIRIICDSRLRIPLDSQICRTVGEYETIIACAEENDKADALKALGIEVISVPDAEGSIDLKKLMGILGARSIDSILLEGGSTLNESALQAGIISEVRAFIAPKMFGGTAKSPVEGAGVEDPDQAIPMELIETEMFGEDLMLRYLVKEK